MVSCVLVFANINVCAVKLKGLKTPAHSKVPRSSLDRLYYTLEGFRSAELNYVLG